MNIQNFDEIPFTIGVVGHVDVIVDENLILDIKSKLRHIINNTNDCIPIILQSQLAKGADTLIAQIFLELKAEYPMKDIRLYVPLPMPQSDYESDFLSDELAIFRQLCTQATKVFELSDSIEQGRDKCYEQGADYVVNSSMLLMVLWDGVFNQKIGGTSETVKKIHYGTSKASIQLNNDLPMLLWKVHRRSTSVPVTVDHELFNIYNYQNLMEQKTIESIFNFLNKSQEIKSKISRVELQESVSYLSMIDYNMDDLNEEHRGIIRFFAINDAISIKEQNRYLWISKGVFVLSFISMFLFQFYEQFDLNPIITVLFASMMIVLYVYTKMFNISMGDNNAFLQHRLVAETLRINFYLLCLGISPKRHEESAIVHRESWVNQISMSLIYLATKNKDLVIDNCYYVVNNNWLKSQKEYFDKKIGLMTNKVKFFELIIKYTSVAIIMFLLLTLLNIFFGYEYLDDLMNINFILFLVFLITKTYYEFREYDNVLLQSITMASIFNKYIECITTHDYIDNTIYLELSNKALTELHLWYLVYRDKKPSLEI